MIDPFHLEKYGEYAVNYNRDVEAFPLLSAIFEKIIGECPYSSPTDMESIWRGTASPTTTRFAKPQKREIIRRYYTSKCRQLKCLEDDETVYKIELVMKQAGVTALDRAVTVAALKRAEETGKPAAALELEDGTVITGKRPIFSVHRLRCFSTC